MVRPMMRKRSQFISEQIAAAHYPKKESQKMRSIQSKPDKPERTWICAVMTLSETIMPRGEEGRRRRRQQLHQQEGRKTA